MKFDLPLIDTALSGNPNPERLLGLLVDQHGSAIVGAFYETLLQDDEGKTFLSHAAVHDRLSASLLEWLRALFGEKDVRVSKALQDQQRIVGEVHARIKIPIHLVMRGALVIKTRISQLLLEQELATPVMMSAVLLANARVDSAIAFMSSAYEKNATAQARLDEAYRLFSLDQDASIEKEAQRASLMEWSQATLFSLLRKQEMAGLARLSDSPFGLWIRHRADFMFGPSTAFQDLLAAMERIDTDLLPRLEAMGRQAEDLGILTELQTCVDHISFLIGELFQTIITLENGRDPLTRTLNRRFMSAILGREIKFASDRKSPLCVILLDIDHFKAINDAHGHQGGDAALRQVAQIIGENVRPCDFIFRYGGEEFLILLAETPILQARSAAERIRLALATRPVAVGTATMKITASFGIANHAGHPDPDYLVRAADEALYRAKANGRNRIEIAEI